MADNRNRDRTMGGRFNNRREESAKEKYGKAVDQYKALLADKVHPDNRTSAYDKNKKAIMNRLVTAADAYDEEEPGSGIFSLIILSLMSSLALKDRQIDLEVKMREMDRKISRLEKR